MAVSHKIIAGLQEALSYIRGECEHEWRDLDPWLDSKMAGRECKRCGVREHTPKSL